VPTVPDPSCTVAHSEDDFAQTQGELGWWYGFSRRALGAASGYDPATDFEAMSYNGTNWEADDPSDPIVWAYLAWWGGHPDGDPLKLPIRRWVSDVNGPASVTIVHRKVDFGGDGTRVLLFVDGVYAWSRDVAGDDGAGFSEAVPVELEPGTLIDVVLHPIGGDGVDTTEETVVIGAP
jgi:hypothetical protein